MFKACHPDAKVWNNSWTGIIWWCLESLMETKLLQWIKSMPADTYWYKQTCQICALSCIKAVSSHPHSISSVKVTCHKLWDLRSFGCIVPTVSGDDARYHCHKLLMQVSMKLIPPLSLTANWHTSAISNLPISYLNHFGQTQTLLTCSITAQFGQCLAKQNGLFLDPCHHQPSKQPSNPSIDQTIN